MGVHGLWQLLQPVGEQATLESLKGKVLAIDVSVWLHQSMKGMRDKYGNTVHNAHLQFLFKRVSKLLFYGIKPVFVFDGGVPLLKRQTIAGRRHKREDAWEKKEKTAKKLLQNVMKHHAVNTVLGNGSPITVSLPQSQREKDMFELPALPETDHPLEDDSQDDWDDRMLQRQEIFNEYQNLDEIDVESEDFKSLPPEIQHEILSDLRNSRKHSSWTNIDRLPTDSGDFSAYQMQKLRKQSKLSRKIETVRKELNTYHSGNMDGILNDEELASQISVNKVASDDTIHYILVKRLPPDKNIKFENSKVDKSNDRAEVKPILQGEGTVTDAKELNDYNTEIHADVTENRLTFGKMESVQNTDSISEETISCSAKEGEQVSGNQEQLSVQEGTDGVLSQKTEEALSDDVTEIMHRNITGKVHLHKLNKEQNSDHLPHPVDETKIIVEQKPNQVKRLAEPLLPDYTEKKPKLDTPASNFCNDKSIIGLKHTEPITCAVLFPDQQVGNINKEESKENYSSEEDDDNDFLEVTINPDTIESHNLFPASLFIPAHGVTNDKDQNEAEAGFNDEKILLSRLDTQAQEFKEYLPVEREGSSNSTDNLRSQFKDMIKGDLENVQATLVEETAVLTKEQGKQERLATSITDQMQKDSQELLVLFGVPFIVAPMEAEAQCAFLDLTNQTQGTVTDDSDIWLFGGQRVYRNFFNQNKYVEYFSHRHIEDRLLLTRDQMVKLAYLCGCDYSDGIQGVGPVTGLEVLLEFPGEKLEGLNNLKDWWTSANKQVKCDTDTKLKTKLKTLYLGEGFPNPAVYEAFMEPVVDDSTDQFTWGRPDLDLLREFAYDKLDWTKAKVDEIILPVVKEMNKKDTQSNITSFFNTESLSKSPLKSKRVKRVLTRMKDQGGVVKGKKGKSSKRLPAKNKISDNNGASWVKDDQDTSTMTNKDVNLSENSSSSE